MTEKTVEEVLTELQSALDAWDADVTGTAASVVGERLADAVRAFLALADKEAERAGSVPHLEESDPQWRSDTPLTLNHTKERQIRTHRDEKEARSLVNYVNKRTEEYGNVAPSGKVQKRRVFVGPWEDAE